MSRPGGGARRLSLSRWRWLLAACLLAGRAAAAEPFEPWPGVDYSDAVPRLEAVVGHDFGAEITAPADLHRYLQALAAAAPERTRLVEYARSWEGRPLHYLLISSAANVARLDEVRAGMQQLADPRGRAQAELTGLLDDLPVVVWLAHGVHGDEISSSDAALLTAYHLLAATDPEIARWLEDVVVVIDPTQNPDGRARFVAHYQQTRGIVPQPSPIAAERSQPWPGGRYNHYLFDMNRDWFALTQPEARGRVAAFLDYFPLVHVDLHEMGTDSSYYFPPPAVPYNPYLRDAQKATLELFGRGMAEAFDRFGFRYYTREVFDAYYPGYGDTWPALHGAAGMTFEMASAGGLLGQRSNGALLSYRDGVQRHFVTSLSVVQSAAGQRRRLLEDFLALRRDPPGDRVYALSRAPDPGRADKLADLLRQQGVEVRRLPEAARVCGSSLAAGSYLVAEDQPAGRLAATLLAAESPAAAAFWEEQERRAAKRLPVEVYDVVAWSLPQLYGVPMSSCSMSVGRYPVVTEVGPQEAAPGDARIAYLVPWGSRGAARFLAAALRDDLRVEVATRTFERGGISYPRGSLIVSRSANDADLPQRIRQLAGEVRIDSADGSWMDGGIDLGSDNVYRVAAPHVALAWDEPTVPTSAGAWRYVLEQKLGYPVTPVRVRDLGSAWLDQFDVLVLPEGDGYGEALEVDNLQRWVRRGGTLIGAGSAVEYLAQAELLAAPPELRAGDDAGDADADSQSAESAAAAGGDDGDEPEAGAPVPGQVIDGDDAYRAALRPAEERPQQVSGVLVNAAVDPDHWLAAGLPEQVSFMISGLPVYAPLRLDQGTNVAVFAAADELVAGGYLWDDVRRQLARKPAALVQTLGRGQVIGFTADPAFRGMLDGLDVLIANAVFFGPAVAGPVPAPPPVR